MKARGRASALVLALAAVVGSPAVARAQSTAPVIEGAGLDARTLDDLIALELGDDAARVRRVHVAVHDGRADVAIDVASPPGAIETRRASVALPAAEPERALALFIAELARGATARPAPAPTPAPAPAPTPAPAPAPAWHFAALATMGARLVTTGGALVPTPRVEIGARRGALRLGAIARYGYASAHDELGDVRAHALAGGLAATWTLASSASIALATGPRAEVGLVAGRGDGANGDSTTAATLAGAWELELHVNVGGAFLFGAVEGGTLARGVELHADDRDALHLAGPFVGASIGAGL